MSLEEYAKKRKFSKTPEPAPAVKSSGKPIFVIQEHHATHLHYDFRLEIQGVLKSWAVPKGVATEAGVKRLAVETEDHPLDYANFEGIIPKGSYGAGRVVIWDRGTCEMREQKPGSMVFELHGARLRGAYAMVHMKGKNWLIFKKG